MFSERGAVMNVLADIEEAHNTIAKILENNDECKRIFTLVDSQYHGYSKDYELILLKQIVAIICTGYPSTAITSAYTIAGICQLATRPKQREIEQLNITKKLRLNKILDWISSKLVR
jgi:hypothetical protein